MSRYLISYSAIKVLFMVRVACLESLMLSGGMQKNPKLHSWVIYWGTRYLIEFDLDNICE